jgi:hypothetical protein
MRRTRNVVARSSELKDKHGSAAADGCRPKQGKRARCMLKAIAVLCVVVGGSSAICLLPVTCWLLGETARDPKTRGMALRIRAVPAAAIRGEWPDLRSAQWYRRLLRVLLTAWIIGAVSGIADEVTNEIGL